ncbi:MAG: endo-1,4-beta-xylanase [Promethearchaeota archaeon]
MQRNKGYYRGLIIFIIINSSVVFLILSPYIPNPIGQYLDDQFLANVDERIESIRKDDFKITITYSNGTKLKNTNIEFTLIQHDFYFGCNFFEFESFDKSSHNEKYLKYFKNLFNLATIPFYWNGYEPKEGKFPNIEWLHNITTWCTQRNITKKGHPIIWRNSELIPDWVDPNDPDILTVLKERIIGVIEEFKDEIEIWDVVNEPTHLPSFGAASVVDYTSSCFKWAHEEDNNAKLTLNDYGIMGHDFGFGPYYQLINTLLEKNVPIDYIGLQGREPRMDWIPAVEIWNTLEAYSVFDLPIHITEFTCPSSGFPITNSWKKGVWTEENQAEYAKRYYKTCFSHPNVEAIIWWDLYDGRSWVQNGGLLDEDWNPKKSYKVLDELINKEWHTSGSKKTNNEGLLEFKGFFGTYNITIPKIDQTFIINAERGKNTDFEIIIL